ncbi:MAG: HAMP domain-containing sensor histidine kinase [Tissierellia bacterium]|nr:HAMP domain-containing sensor histidine kinase [Tissierellia bacterium]
MGKLKKNWRDIAYSLKVKLFLYAFAIFIVFILGFEIFSYYSLKDYHYNNLKNFMHTQAKLSSELYVNQLGDFTLADNVLNENFSFLNNIDGQIQIIDNSGKVLYDNIASDQIGQIITDEDVEQALNASSGTSISPFRHGERTLSVSVPLNDKSVQVGVLRTSASLRTTDLNIAKQFLIFIIFGSVAAIVGGISSFYLSRRIFRPINKLTEVAKKYSDGQYKEKSNIPYEGEIGELAKTMDQMSENIIEKEAIKTEFISSVSHELRTPLTSIKGWSITLQDEGIDKELTNEGLQIIEKESDRLSDMVEDLLDFSRFTSPNFKLSKSSFNIVEATQTIISQLKPRVTEKSINLLFNYNDKKIDVVADINRIKQVFINLLDNAIKFTPIEGTIVVNIEGRDDEVVCQVIDTGIGISEDEIGKVTQKFYKGTSSASHTGLGLSICEEIVKAHNGRLTITSVEGEGTTVEFNILGKVQE